MACTLLLIYLHGWTAGGTAIHASAKWAHMQFGIAVLLVMLPRLLVRAWRTAPAVVPRLPRWQEWVAKAMLHLALYILLIATPLLGVADRM